MKKHFIETKSVMMDFTACGLHRCVLDPKAETKQSAKVTCGNCKKVLKGREK